MMKKEKLRSVFNEVDPAGAFLNENVDEYDAEIQDLLESNIDLHNPQETEKELRSIFKKYFEGVEIENVAIERLAMKISDLQI